MLGAPVALQESRGLVPARIFKACGRTYFAKSVPLATKDHHSSGFGWQELCSFKPLELQVTACSRVGWKNEIAQKLLLLKLEICGTVSFFQPRTARADFSKATLGSAASLCRAATDSTPRSLPSMGRRGLGLCLGLPGGDGSTRAGKR